MSKTFQFEYRGQSLKVDLLTERQGELIERFPQARAELMPIVLQAAAEANGIIRVAGKNKNVMCKIDAEIARAEYHEVAEHLNTVRSKSDLLTYQVEWAEATMVNLLRASLLGQHYREQDKFVE